MANGYWQKLLRVDLTTRHIHIEDIPEKDLRMFIGGAGLGGELLRREVSAKTPAYSPENRVIFATGPFQGPPVPGGAKFSIVGISPVTGTFADTAAGADWGPGLKDAGFDLLVVQGASTKPVYLYIVDGKAEIRDASDLWGKDSYETVDAIRAKNNEKNLSVAAIGPAGERKVAVACVVVDKHSFAGRCGLGAVMGSKNLKAVAVRGSMKAPVHNPEKVRSIIQEFQRIVMATSKENGFRDHGTPSICESVEGLGDMPIKYWDGDRFPEGARRLGAPNSTKVLQAKPYPCRFCPVGCHRKIKVTEPAEYAQQGIGPEYETYGMMGSNLLIDDPKAVAKANDIANRLGIDTISTGAMIGFAMECYEKGWISQKETNGIELEWGNTSALITLTEQIGRREGFGALFSDGTLPAAKKIGSQAVDIVAHVKGLDLPAHDARACISLAPTYATGTRGACHFRGGCEDVEMGGFFIPEIGIKEGLVKFFEPENQSLLAIKCQDYFCLLNSIVLCDFVAECGFTFTGVRNLFNAMTGWDFSFDDLMETGERSFVVQRLINIRDGFDASTDKLPGKMFKPAKEGLRAGKVPPFKQLMGDYYRIRDWDESGVPRPEVLSRLGLR